jgi:hypothetical protein
VRRYLWNILISIDQLLSAMTGGAPDETVSSRFGKAARDGSKFGVAGAWVLDKIFGKDHCKESIEELEGSEKILRY